MLRRANEIAEEAHAVQVDKGGAPYITHPRRVAAAVEGVTAQTVALLHDVVEDGRWTACNTWFGSYLMKSGTSGWVGS